MSTSGRRSDRPGSDGQIATQTARTEGVVELGLVNDIGVRRAVAHIPTVLGHGEMVRCAASGFLEGRSGLIVATSERILFVYKDQTIIDVLYRDIRAYRAKVGIISAELVIEDPAGRAVIKQIHPRHRLVELAELIREPSSNSRSDDSSVRTATEVWRPNLRTKVSPMPARQGNRAEKASPIPKRQPVRLTGTSELPEGPDGWRPHFTEVVESDAASARASSLSRFRASGSVTKLRTSPSMSSWDGKLRTGEWLVASYPDVLSLRGSSDDDSCAGVVAVTNRRLIFVQVDGLSQEWSFAMLEATVGGSPSRIALCDGSALDFPDATTARDFSTAARAAVHLSHPPARRVGKEAE